MKSVLRLATVDPDERSRTVLKSMLVGVDTVWLEAECARYEVFMEVARQTLPDIAVVNLDSNPQRGLQLVETWPDRKLAAQSLSSALHRKAA